MSLNGDQVSQVDPNLLSISKALKLNVRVFTNSYRMLEYNGVGDIMIENDDVLTIYDRQGIAIAKFSHTEWDFYEITEYSIPGDHDHEAAKNE